MNKGKAKCEKLKAISRAIAEANNIDYIPTNCTFEGECSGTCPKCDAEVEQLNQILEQKEAKGEEVVIPEIDLEEQDIIPEKEESQKSDAPKERRMVNGMVKIGDPDALEELRRKLRKEADFDSEHEEFETPEEPIEIAGMPEPVDEDDYDEDEEFALAGDIIFDDDELEGDDDELEGEERLLGDITNDDDELEDDEVFDEDEDFDKYGGTPRLLGDVIFDDSMDFDPESGKFIHKRPSSLRGLVDKDSEDNDKPVDNPDLP